MKAFQLVVTACMVWVLLCPGRLSFATMPGMEEWLDRWQPGPEHAQVPMDSIRHRGMDITGKWWGPHSIGHAVSALAIGPVGGGSYRVIVKGNGCLGRLRFARTGEYDDGLLTLERPVQDYLGRVYKKLYAVRIAGEEYLLPSASVGEVEEAVSENGSQTLDPDVLRSRLFVRQPAQQVSTPSRPPSRAMVVVMVCAGAGLLVFIVFTTFSGRTLASTRGSPRIPTGYRRRTWDELTSSPQF